MYMKNERKPTYINLITKIIKITEKIIFYGFYFVLQIVVISAFSVTWLHFGRSAGFCEYISNVQKN